MQAIPRDSSANEVLVIGGCHVTGWKIGDSPCFWSGAANYWSDGRRTTRHGHASFPKVVKILRNHDIDPYGTLLILQMGNFEAQELAIVRPFLGRVKKLFTRSANVPSNFSPEAENGEPNVLSRKSEVKLLITGGILLCIESIMPKMYRKKRIDRISERLMAMFDHVLASNPRETIVLSTFPTASPVHNFYRKTLNRIMRVQAEDRGFTYIDVFTVLKDARSSGELPTRSLFADGVHLAARGHALLSKAITDQLDTELVANRYAFGKIAA